MCNCKHCKPTEQNRISYPSEATYPTPDANGYVLRSDDKLSMVYYTDRGLMPISFRGRSYSDRAPEIGIQYHTSKGKLRNITITLDMVPAIIRALEDQKQLCEEYIKSRSGKCQS